MTSGHVLAIGLFLTGLATQMQALHSWDEVKSITFAAGVLMNVGGIIVSMLSKQIGRDPTSQDRRHDGDR